MRETIKNKIFYVIAVLVTLYLALIYRPAYWRFLLGFEIILAICMELYVTYIVRCITVTMETEKNRVQKGTDVVLKVQITNRSLFPVPLLMMNLIYTHYFTGQEEKIRIKGKADANSVTERIYHVPAKHCGVRTFSLVDFRVCDLFQLCSRKRITEEQVTITVIPNLYPVEIEITNQVQTMPLEAEDFHPNRPGNDVTEIFQVREYRGGDGLQRVHWKLSAKEDELLVKDYSEPLACNLLFLVDYSIAGVTPEEETMDAFFEAAISISYSLQMSDYQHYLAWGDEKGVVTCKKIQKEEDVLETMEAMLHTKVYNNTYDLSENYYEQTGNEYVPWSLRLQTNLELYKNSQMINCFAGEKIKDALEGFILVL